MQVSVLLYGLEHGVFTQQSGLFLLVYKDGPLLFCPFWGCFSFKALEHGSFRVVGRINTGRKGREKEEEEDNL